MLQDRSSRLAQCRWQIASRRRGMRQLWYERRPQCTLLRTSLSSFQVHAAGPRQQKSEHKREFVNQINSPVLLFKLLHKVVHRSRPRLVPRRSDIFFFSSIYRGNIHETIKQIIRCRWAMLAVKTSVTLTRDAHPGSLNYRNHETRLPTLWLCQLWHKQWKADLNIDHSLPRTLTCGGLRRAKGFGGVDSYFHQIHLSSGQPNISWPSLLVVRNNHWPRKPGAVTGSLQRPFPLHPLLLLSSAPESRTAVEWARTATGAESRFLPEVGDVGVLGIN